jgi:hypothetical protein
MIHAVACFLPDLIRLHGKKINTPATVMEIPMQYHEFAMPPHAGTRSRGCAVQLLVHDDEWVEMQRLCQEHAAIGVIRVAPTPVRSMHNVEVLCASRDAASALSRAWATRLI